MNSEIEKFIKWLDTSPGCVYDSILCFEKMYKLVLKLPRITRNLILAELNERPFSLSKGEKTLEKALERLSDKEIEILRRRS